MGYKKMTENEMTGIGVSSAGNILTGSAEQNKRVFDNLPIAIGKNVNEVIDALEGVDAKAASHTASKANPHSVTKAQVGLGNVDNTADLDKPVSVAVAAALDKKANVKDVYTRTEVDTAISNVTIPVDEVLDETSENPVQNRVVAAAIGTKADADDAVGKKTEHGEIFNDYVGNRALYTNNHAEGSGTTAGFTGYKMLSVTANGTSSIDIEVRDKDLARKASSAYAVGDVINFEAQLHWAEITTINSFSASADGNTVINVTYFTQHGLDASDDEAENWLSVTGKEGGEPIAQYHSAHAEGEGTIAAGRSGHAEGRDTKVVGNHGHAEGRSTKAGYCAHAEGKGAEALADASHAEGNSKATGMRAHAENSNTEARGAYSHSEGLHTVAASGSQHVQGKYNEIDSSDKYAHIVGCGTGTAEEQRKNIHTLDWNGSGWFAGDVTVGENKDKLATKAELDAGLKVKADKGTTLKDYGITDSAGLKTASGEIFNDYTNNKAIAPYTHAEGFNTLAGRKTFKVYSVDGNKLKLDSVSGLEDGDIVSYSVYVSGDGILSPGWTPLNDVTKITAIDTANKTITVSGVDSRLTTDIITNHSSSGYVGLWVNEKPEAGTIGGASYSHAEGARAWAIGSYSHAEGHETVASGVYAHAEGNGSIASGETSHAEGAGCLARGMRSHAEGGDTEARGSYSHSEGWHTITKGTAQHAEGIANEEMGSDYLHIVGNGSVVIKDGVKTVNRSNAYTLDKKGNGWYAGNVTVGENKDKLVTEAELATAISNAALDGADVVVDSVLSASSENPIQNKAVTAALAGKADKADVYTKTEVNAVAETFATKGELNDYWTSEEVKAELALKADDADVYTKTETNNLLSAKADKATTLSGYGIGNAYTKTEVDTKVSAKADKAEVASLSDAVSALGDVANEDVVPISKGGTGATTAASALAALGGVSKTGDTMTGNLTVKTSFMPMLNIEGPKSFASLFKNSSDTVEGGLHIRDVADKSDVNSYVTLKLEHEEAISDIGKALQLILCTNGTSKTYKVLHEGNMAELGVARVETKTYKGAGNGLVTVTFSFTPKVVFIGGGEHSSMVVYGSKSGTISYGNYSLSTTWSGNTLTFNGANNGTSHDTEGVTYTVVAIR